MKLVALTSAAALAAALAAFTPAVAQDTMQMTLNGEPVSEGDMPHVQKRCNELALEAGESLVKDEDDAEDTDEDLDSSLLTIDLETITLEQCKEGGFVDTNAISTE